MTESAFGSPTLILGCGPWISFSKQWPWVVAIVFLIFKPLAYLAFAHAFRYRVSQVAPLSNRKVIELAVSRTVLGLGIGALGGLFFYAQFSRFSSGFEIVTSWLYIYLARFFCWWFLGSKRARLRGHRLAAWIFWGMMINVGFDVAALGGLLSGWLVLPIIGFIAVPIAILGLVGRRQGLKARFDTSLCKKCSYDLTGNVSGVCPECGTPMVQESKL